MQSGLIVVNFSHPLTDEQLEQIRQMAGMEIERVIDVPCQFDHQQSFVLQARAMIDGVELSARQWQSGRVLINLPALNTIAAIVLAELHGRMGYFPPIIRLRPVPGAVTPQFEVAEIINLQQVRDAARAERGATE